MMIPFHKNVRSGSIFLTFFCIRSGGLDRKFSIPVLINLKSRIFVQEVNSTRKAKYNPCSPRRYENACGSIMFAPFLSESV